jgi:acylpyruvate hydrolase
MNQYWKLSTKAVCAGRNYVAHARELSNPLPANPFFFIKPTTSFLPYNDVPLGGISGDMNKIEYPKDASLHHELELCVIIGEKTKNVSEKDALSKVAGFAIGLDMTLRDVQDAQKAKSLPWTPAKAFDTSLGLGPFILSTDIPNPNDLELWLTVDGEIKQAASTSLMIFNVQRLISDASKITTLMPGDIVMTGTPEGVGQVMSGAVIKAGIKGMPSADCEFTVMSV